MLYEVITDPRDYGFSLCQPNELVGGNAELNTQIARAILSGENGPKRDVVLLNSGACLYLADKADSIESGIKLAAQTIDSGAAMRNNFV